MPARKDLEGRHANAVVVQDLLADALVASENQTPGVAPGVPQAQQLEVGHHVVVEGGHVIEGLHEVEGDVGRERVDRLPDRGEVGADAEDPHLVALLLQRLDHVELGFPGGGEGIDAFGVPRRHEVRVDEGQNTQSFLHVFRDSQCGGVALQRQSHPMLDSALDHNLWCEIDG